MSPLYFAVGSYDRLANEVPLSASDRLPWAVIELLPTSVPPLAESTEFELPRAIPDISRGSSL